MDVPETACRATARFKRVPSDWPHCGVTEPHLYLQLLTNLGYKFIVELHRLIRFDVVCSMRKLMTDFHHRLEQEIPRLRRYARALTRNAVRADDLVQETLVRALRKEHLWQAGTNLRAWLFTIMHNQNVNDVRRAMRDDTVDLE